MIRTSLRRWSETQIWWQRKQAKHSASWLCNLGMDASKKGRKTFCKMSFFVAKAGCICSKQLELLFACCIASIWGEEDRPNFTGSFYSETKAPRGVAALRRFRGSDGKISAWYMRFSHVNTWFNINDQHRIHVNNWITIPHASGLYWSSNVSLDWCPVFQQPEAHKILTKRIWQLVFFSKLLQVAVICGMFSQKPWLNRATWRTCCGSLNMFWLSESECPLMEMSCATSGTSSTRSLTTTRWPCESANFRNSKFSHVTHHRPLLHNMFIWVSQGSGYGRYGVLVHTVDGRNPAPVDK